jgi:uncharacterized protein YhfF
MPSVGSMRSSGSAILSAADEGAALIKQEVKTATSSLLWTYEAVSKPLPEVGSLSIVTDGGGDPVCVVETIAVDIKGLPK